MAPHNAVFYFSLAFLLGVAAAGFELPLLTTTTAAAVIFLAADYLLGQPASRKYVFLLVAAVFAGAFYYHFRIGLEAAERNLPLGEEAELAAVVVGEPRGFEKFRILDLRAEPPHAGKATLFTSPFSQIDYGDLIKIKGEIRSPRSDAEDPTIFFPEKIEVLARGGGGTIRRKLLEFKSLLVAQFKQSLPPDESALLAGITFGVRSGFSENFREAMARSGTTHLVALSGYNITILVVAAALAFGSFLSRRKTFIVTTVVIVMFVLMVGGEPSVVRAAIMGFLALLAKEAGRTHSIRNAIVLTALAMILVNPKILAHDAGFQLSFVSLLGIVYLSPAIKNFLKIDGVGFAGWKENAVLTTSAQFAVLPVIVGTFGEFSLSAVAANVLLLEFIPLTMFLGFVLAAVGSIFSYLGFFASNLVGLLLSYEVGIIELFANLRLPLEAPLYGAAMFAAIYYAAIILFIHHFSRSTYTRRQP